MVSVNSTSSGKFTSFDHPPKSIGLKILVVVVIALGVITMITGILAVLASKGVLSKVSTLNSLAKIGVVNSAIMAAGGLILLIIGIAGAILQFRKEHQVLC